MPMLGWEKKFDFKDLTFGVEIETAWPEIAHSHGFALPCRSAVEERLQAANLNWSVVGDASISGWELVSPILHYPDGIREIEVVCEILRSMDFTVDEHCGVHIHVGFPNDVQALRRLLRNVGAMEDMIYTVARGRDEEHRGNRYCRSISKLSSPCSFQDLVKPVPSMRALAIKWYGDEACYEDGSSSKYHSSRYHGLNLHSYWFRGTVEFRYFNGTLDPGIIRAWVVLCLKLVARSIGCNGSMNTPTRWDPRSTPSTKWSNWDIFRECLVYTLGFSKMQVGYFSYIQKRLATYRMAWSDLKREVF